MDERRKNTTNKGKKGKKKEKLSLWSVLCRTLFAIILFLAIGVAYLWKAQYFLNHFYENTWINGIDCSDLEAEEVKKLIQEKVEEYELVISTREGEHYTITGEQIDLEYVDNYEVDILLGSQDPLLWLKKVLADVKYEVSANTRYDKSKVSKIVQDFPFMKEDEMIQPQDAYVAETEEGYVVVPEVEGNALESEVVLEIVNQAVAMGKTELSLEDEACYLKPSIYQDSTDLQLEAKGLNDLTTANIKYVVCGETHLIDHEVLKSWLKQYDNGVYYIDPQEIEDFIHKLADSRDSLGKTREFTTHAGEVITLSNNQYGWKVDREQSLQALRIAIEDGFEGTLDLVYEQKALGEGKNDLGDVYIEISIQEQMMWCYKDGSVLVETPIVTGMESNEEYATPRDGCWHIYRKATKYTIKGPTLENGEPEYTEFAQYWLPFYGSVGIYDKESRGDAFGGDIYVNDGSHGSVQAPLEAVKQIYDVVKVGTPVIVY